MSEQLQVKPQTKQQAALNQSIQQLQRMGAIYQLMSRPNMPGVPYQMPQMPQVPFNGLPYR